MSEAKPTSIEIQSGVAIPSVTRKSTYPFEKMQIGDSFFVPGEKAISGVRAAAVAYRKKSEGKFDFITRKEGDGFRLWCVAPE